jgi:L-threonylcarbamoyladenylate synthase
LKKVDIAEARNLLLNGEVVAIPTETVYGLGGWIYSEDGLKKIFSTKERPFFDPLIVHVDTIDKARDLSSEWTEVHEVLAKSCWPGPLTLIARKNEKVSPLITSGLDSVGLRCPRHPMTLKLLSQIEGGIAAPSANKFGKTSPTSAAHVEQEFQEMVSIVDGGSCEVGIESTVAGVVYEKDSYKVLIYRPGFYTAQNLHDILKQQGMNVKVLYAESPVAPGQLKHHYMPQIPLVILPAGFDWNKNKSIVQNVLQHEYKRPKFWQLPTDPQLASRTLYQDLREFDKSGFDIILTYKEPCHESEDWKGIWNRLEKAAILDKNLLLK